MSKQDTKTKPLETRLHEIVDGLRLFADEKTRWEEARLIRAQEHEQEERIREELVRQRRGEDRRRERLDELSANYEAFGRVSRFVAAIRAEMVRRGVDLSDHSDSRVQWLRWAQDRVDSLDLSQSDLPRFESPESNVWPDDPFR